MGTQVENFCFRLVNRVFGLLSGAKWPSRAAMRSVGFIFRAFFLATI